MKKLSLAAFVSLIICIGSAYAQVSYGVKAGINMTGLNVWDMEEVPSFFSGFSTRTGFHMGGFVNIGVTENFSVQPELRYSLQGSRNDYEIQDIPVRGEPELSYLVLPVMAQYRAAGRFYVEAGPQAGLLLHAQLDNWAIGEGGGGEVEGDAKNLFKDLDFSLGFGLGYKFPFGLGINARYNLGLSNISNTNNIGAENRVLSAGLSYTFPKE